MNQEIVIWCSVVVVLFVLLAIKTISDLRKGKKSRVISLASEKELFYLPGDILHESDEN